MGDYNFTPQLAPITGQVADMQQDLQNMSNSLIGKVFNSVDSAKKPSLPWNNQPKPRFFLPIDIDPNRWNALFPYRLLVVDVKRGHIVNGGSPKKITIKASNSNTTVDFNAIGGKWEFTLPITPQQLNIVDSFSINTSATLRGVLEEHNGVKFKLVNASGTMGVWPFKASVTKPPEPPSFVQSLFGGTLSAVGNVVNQFNRVINTATSNHPASKPITLQPDETNSPGILGTGYFNAIALQQFLEQYAEAKKRPENAGWRLVFDIPKQNQAFIVTPMQFVWQQSETKPNQINYSFQLKAWRRIDLGSKQDKSVKTTDISPITLQRILNTISEARKLMGASRNLIGAIRSDINAPFEALRQTTLFVKDLAGVALTAIDLPASFCDSAKSSISTFMNQMSTGTILNSISSDPEVRDAFKHLNMSFQKQEGISPDAVNAGQLGPIAAKAQSIDPAFNIFKNVDENFTLFNNVPVTNLNLNFAQQEALNNIVDTARQTTVNDLKSFRSTVQELAFQLSNYFGAGDAYYNKVYGKPTPTSRITPMTVDEYELLKSLYDTMQSYDILTATTQIDDLNKTTNMEYVAGLADLSGIPFELSSSKILAPVPFGLTMEAIAARYLGDPQRWIEIATLNNLRDPYIDENGFKLPLLSNAASRQITVGSIDNLYIGQRVLLKSSTQTPTARKILGINRLSDISFLLTLDGEANLGVFITADGAYLQAYLPGTVNSQQKIFIPSDLPVPNDPNIIPPASTSGDPLVGMSKVDWLLTDDGDLAVNGYGDFRLSAGITNIIQALKIKLGTQKGTVLTHPDFGLGLQPGISTSDVDVQNIYDSISKLIEQDQRFQGLASLQIQLNGPTLTVSMGVLLAGQQGVYPITFELAA